MDGSAKIHTHCRKFINACSVEQSGRPRAPKAAEQSLAFARAAHRPHFVGQPPFLSQEAHGLNRCLGEPPWIKNTWHYPAALNFFLAVRCRCELRLGSGRVALATVSGYPQDGA